MNLTDFYALLTYEGQLVLKATEKLQPREADYLMHFQRLSKIYTADLARAALEISILRREALSKFPPMLARRLYLTREALEQATSYYISKYRAERYRRQLNPKIIIDLGCSIGGDTLAFMGVTTTIGIDRDLIRLNMARANLNALAQIPEYQPVESVDFFQADLINKLPLAAESSTGLFFDPSRRVDHKRVYSVNDYQPTLNVILEWLPKYPALGVKLSPGVNLAELVDYQAEIEFISLHGELKECMLWFGDLRRTERCATLLPDGAQMLVEFEKSTREVSPRLSAPQAYLYEPDPAVIRAGFVRQLAEKLNATQLDPDIAYLTSQTLVTSPFARMWRVEAWFPFNLKRLRAYLRQAKVGRVTIKKRGSPLEPQTLIRQLHLKGDQERILFLTHLNGDPIVLVCLPSGS